MFILDPNSGIPIYRQLMEQVRRMVAGGQLQPGDTLPSVRELAVSHTVNPMTISKAYSLLEAEGWLERQRGKGMIVAIEGAARENKSGRLQRLQPSIEQLALAAAQLELGVDDVIGALRRRMEKPMDKMEKTEKRK